MAVGQVVCLIDTAAERPEGQASTTKPSTQKAEAPAPVDTNPKIDCDLCNRDSFPGGEETNGRKGLSPDQIVGSGRDGRIFERRRGQRGSR